MAISHKNLSRSKSEYVKTYENIKGVDFSADCAVSEGRLPYMENLYRDYDAESDYIIESVPGYRKLFSLGAKINALYHQKVSDGEGYVVCHAGNKLFRFSVEERDSGQTLSAIGSLKDARSAGFCYGNDLYILDGEKITVVSKEGTVSGIGPDSDVKPYVPTTFINATEHEQLNLLTDDFVERYTLGALSEISYGTPSLKYEITDEKRRVCEVVGVGDNFSGELFIPSSVKIGADVYTVESIGANAFLGHPGISSLVTNEGLIYIGESAFKSCPLLTRVIISSSVKEIRSEAFSDCKKLTTIYIGREIERISENAFADLSSTNRAFYELSPTEFSKVAGHEVFLGSIEYFTKYAPVRIELALHTPAREISAVKIDGKAHSYSINSDESGIRSVIIHAMNKSSIIGCTVDIYAKARSDEFTSSTHGTDVRTAYTRETEEGILINKCTKAAIFDGRIFLSGNPDMPNTVFYSSKGRAPEATGLYFGAYDYENDGVGGHGVVSMMAAQDTLFVFKSADEGDGGIFYHTAKKISDEVKPVSYPVTYTHSGVCSLGASAVFYDDPMFISEIGICGFDKNNGTVGRDVVCRSHNVNPKLLCENLTDLRMTVWKGYLVAAVDSRIYLADSRQLFRHKTGGREYEWFFLNDVGDPLETALIYRYHSLQNGIYYIHDKPDEKVSKSARIVTIFDHTNPENTVYYAIENGTRYHAYITGERKTAGFSKTSDVLGVADLLFVGCQNGAILVFNNDMRGKAPSRFLENDDSFDAKEFAEIMGRRLHSDFYDFAGIAPRYVIKTGWDNCGIPYLAKNTARGSVSIKCKCWAHSKIKCDSETDKAGYADQKGFSACALSFADFHFDSLSFNTYENVTVTSKLSTKKWTEQQICVYSDTYRAPIGIYSISYRFNINGRIK